MTIISKIQKDVEAGVDKYKIANWLINLEIAKHIPVSLEDLPDTEVTGSEVEAVVEALEEKDYQGAINIAIDGAINILEEEGFDIEENS